MTGCQSVKDAGGGMMEFVGFDSDVPQQKQGSKKLKELSKVNPVVTVGNHDNLYSEDKIVWADEDPDKPMAELEAVWEQGPKDEWLVSYSEAMKQARVKGIPVMIWFTNSRGAATSKSLSNELFDTSEFDHWANKHVIRLRVDSFIQDDDQKHAGMKREYVQRLRKRYKVLGAPVVVVLSPRGNQFGKHTGYRPGSPDYFWGKIKHSQKLALDDYANWRQEYEARGYRVWHDLKGRKVFAKPVSLQEGTLHLVSPDGKRSKTSVKRLSSEDQLWIKEYIRKKNSKR
ncbi:thioredoxin family protein [Rubritalea marina]|uniref:thioredoxin family protein n=1 Tax=Rubritalea marina TaxID=361055 RepID=UPI0003762223|nr:thioredoxin family protein [Rubritalea marina]